MNVKRTILIVSVVALLAGLAGAEEFRRVEGRYHMIYTDAPLRDVREAVVRINAVAEEYARRTGVKRPPRSQEKLPFYLYARYGDFRENLDGEHAGSAGLYTGRELRATLDRRQFGNRGVWHVIQHEAWHQFAHRVLGGGRDLPVWINEGLAEYFGQGLWTGDGLVTGVVDAGLSFDPEYRLGLHLGRLERIQLRLRAGQFRDVEAMLAMTREDWSAELSVVNYDQVFSWVQYLAHADGGRHRQTLQRYLRDVCGGRPSVAAFKKHFGRDLDALREDYRRWWLNRKAGDFADLRDEATARGLMSFLARWNQKGRTFETWTDFRDAARAGELTLDPRRDRELWLPAELLDKALRDAETRGSWSIAVGPNGLPVLMLRREDGTVLRTTCSVLGGGRSRRFVTRTETVDR